MLNPYFLYTSLQWCPPRSVIQTHEVLLAWGGCVKHRCVCVSLVRKILLQRCHSQRSGTESSSLPFRVWSLTGSMGATSELVRNTEYQVPLQTSCIKSLHFNKIPRCFPCTLDLEKHSAICFMLLPESFTTVFSPWAICVYQAIIELGHGIWTA